VTGCVALVGAGPGEADLLTVRAARTLAEADLVLYDALVSTAVLELAPRAQRFCVGKRAGRPSTAQPTIHALMIRAARRGKRVVRLKGGDPFVFGRGGEEALALLAAGVPFEVVPGVSSATAAPSLAGIPVTHRGLASAFVVVSGHAEAAWKPVLSALPPRAATVVVLMGLAAAAPIGSALLASGWPATTPAAVVWGAATAAQRCWLGTLSALAAGIATAAPATDTAAASWSDGGAAAPATLVVGDVVALARRLSPARNASPREGERDACAR
jgi:uroporphyrin-III C-methyltransferase